MRKLYIAIPYSKIDKDLSYNTANRISAHFINRGFLVFSPISHSHVMARDFDLPGDAEFWSTVNHSFIDWADDVIVVKLDGWQDSTGVLDEIEYAIKTGKTVAYVDPGFF